ncbi:thioesterase superfamily protein [Colletotrichum karsti]|uniref:Thioesterase superfamily protein n=1 Tax=Colletotrichum karsti TaxID=1095194 RepID=A0A9P6IGZ9_9PEZI|nr:thioesterase superfamily protein [Colletotrichum karsti]KAF9881951.1 thioesterase superfamily protein [Colletotrichum karsti]
MTKDAAPKETAGPNTPPHFASIFDSEDPEDRIRAWMSLEKNENGQLKSGNWMREIMPHVTLLSINSQGPHPSATFSFTVQPDHCNRANNLHGGCAATLFDFLTTLPLALINDRPGYWQYLGVSRTLQCSYVRPAPCGEECIVECEIVAIGRTLCQLKGVLRRKSDGAIFTTCEHHKFNVDPQPSKL